MTNFPETIEGIGITKTGDLDVLEKLTLPFPEVKKGDIVIKVEWLGVNFIDTYYRQGLYPLPKLPSVIGKEAAGKIVALPTDPEILNDPNFAKREYKIGQTVSVDFLGAHANYISVPWLKVYPVPDGLDSKIAAAATLQCLTAVTFFEEAYKVQKGDIILIHTVAGGLGLLMLQLAKHIGATVIGTTSSVEKAKVAKEHGADHVIIYTKEDTVQRVAEITNGEGVHAVFDGVGKDTFDSNFKMLRRKGTLVSVGNASGAVAPFAPIRLVEKNIKLLRPTMANYLYTPEENYKYGKQVFDLIKQGVLKITIFKEYEFTLESVREAQKDLATRSGNTIGKLVIKVP